MRTTKAVLFLCALWCLAINVALAAQKNETIRTYYIAAEEVEWDYMPTDYDLFRGVPYTRSPKAMVFCEQGPDRIGKVYRKARYVQYTDATFTTKVKQPKWMGYLGPIIRAEVGDLIQVEFLNRATLPFSIHPHGVHYDKDNEGALYADNHPDKKGAYVLPGDKYTYKWEVRESSGPGPADGNSVMWAYHSHVAEAMDIYSGLIGPMIIYLPGILGEDGLPTDVDREFVMMLLVGDENQSRYLEHNINSYCGDPSSVDRDDDDFIESNLMHNINGLFYCNLNDMFMCEGEKVRWNVFAFGTEVDIHTLHWHAQTLLHDGHRLDVIELLPATFRTLYMTIDNPGNWLMHCHVNDHSSAGMQAYYQVSSAKNCSAGFQPLKIED